MSPTRKSCRVPSFGSTRAPIKFLNCRFIFSTFGAIDGELSTITTRSSKRCGDTEM